MGIKRIFIVLLSLILIVFLIGKRFIFNFVNLKNPHTPPKNRRTLIQKELVSIIKYIRSAKILDLVI